jgi:hypothetical protein
MHVSLCKMRFLLIVFLISCLKHKAQYLDTMHAVFNHKSSIDARLESRNSFINNELISVTGVRLGVAFQRKLRIGGGFSWLKSEVKKLDISKSDNGVPLDTTVRFLKFGYLCYYIDFVFYKTKRWQLSVPIQAGTGVSWFQENSKIRPQFGNRTNYLLVLYEPGITAQFKITRWLGLGADVAYRFTLKNNKYVGEKLNSPTYAFKLLFWCDQLYYVLFPESKITKRFGPAVW